MGCIQRLRVSACSRSNSATGILTSGSSSGSLGVAWCWLCLVFHHEWQTARIPFPSTSPSQNCTLLLLRADLWPTSWARRPIWVMKKPNTMASGNVAPTAQRVGRRFAAAITTTGMATRTWSLQARRVRKFLSLNSNTSIGLSSLSLSCLSS